MSDGNGEALSLSIVICTYNRPDLISQVLSTLAEQDAPAEAYEALVIDNASPGDIAAAVRPFDRTLMYMPMMPESIEQTAPTRKAMAVRKPSSVP